MSKDAVFCFTPCVLTSPKLGLYPMQPQNAAGRITDPTVWVPKASGTMKSPTAAAEPLEEPPGVCCGVVRIGRVSQWKSTGKLGRHRLAQ